VRANPEVNLRYSPKAYLVVVFKGGGIPAFHYRFTSEQEYGHLHSPKPEFGNWNFSAKMNVEVKDETLLCLCRRHSGHYSVFAGLCPICRDLCSSTRNAAKAK
jgi:hypothetical protein